LAIINSKIGDLAVTDDKIADLAVTNAKINDMDASKLTGTITIPIDTDLILCERIMTDDGNPNNPSYTFKNNQNTGLWNPGTDVLGFSVGGTNVMTLHKDTGLVIQDGLEV